MEEDRAYMVRSELQENSRTLSAEFVDGDENLADPSLLALPEELERAYHQIGEGADANEAKLALIDTACTACMHSTCWRRAFEQFLPPGLR